MNDLFLLAVNLTRRCNLACAHCYMDAETREAGSVGELSSEEVRQLLDQVAQRSSDTMVVLTGGEPLLRRDLEQLVAHGHGLGLSMVIGTNGVLLSEQRVQSLKAAGALGMGISLDSLNPAHHDGFRGCAGSWEKTLAGMEACRKQQLAFQVHFSVTDENADEVPAMIDFAKASGAHVLNIFFLVCTGRGESMSNISPARYEQVLEQLLKAQNETQDLIIRARCAPHFKRVAYQLDPNSPLTRAQGYEGGGCLAGIHYCRITPEGGVTACPYIPDEEGSIRQEPFWEIWDHSVNFESLRNPNLGGKCGQCEFQKLCGGCRARPLAMGGGLMDADPWCAHEPSGQPVIESLVEQDSRSVAWTPEAEQRLQRVPGFLRKMVKKRAEAHVRDLGEDWVTPEHMAALAAKRFGDTMPPRPSGAATPSVAQTTSAIAWTQEAIEYLEKIPAFLAAGVRQVAEDIASEEGRLEVNIKLLQRLEDEDSPERKLPWEPDAEHALETALEDRSAQVAVFVRPTMQAAAERESKRRNAIVVSLDDVNSVLATHTASVEWQPEALARVESAPEFIRGGIKKAAEWGARREGLARIDSAALTRFRNRAMMRAVRRMKGFGLTELSFDAFATAREKVPRLKDNEQGAKRFASIRRYVESNQKPDGGLGTLDRELIDKMKSELKK